MIERVTTTNIELLALKWGGDVINQVTESRVVPRLVFNRKKGQVANVGDLIDGVRGGNVYLRHSGSRHWEEVTQ